MASAIRKSLRPCSAPVCAYTKPPPDATRRATTLLPPRIPLMTWIACTEHCVVAVSTPLPDRPQGVADRTTSSAPRHSHEA